jgi:hypothetical protein
VPRKNEPVVPKPDAKHLTIREAASVLGITPHVVANRIHRGVIPSWAWTREPGGLRRVLLIRYALEAIAARAKTLPGGAR